MHPLTTDFFLEFIGETTERVPIREPIGFDGGKITIEVKTGGRYARDAKANSKRIEITTRDRKAFDKLMLFKDLYGINSQVSLIVAYDAIDVHFGSFEFSTIKTDQFSYASFLLTRKDSEYKLTKRKNAKIDLFSDKDLDQNSIAPVSTSNILLKTLPKTTVSSWSKSDFWIYTGQTFIPNNIHQNPIKQRQDDEIKNSLSWLFSHSEADNEAIEDFEAFKIINAIDQLTNVEIEFQNIQIKYSIPTGQEFSRAGNWVDFDNPQILFKGEINSEATQAFNVLLNLDFTSEFIETFTVGDRYFPLPVNITPTDLYDEYLVTITDQSFTLQDISKDASLFGLFSLGRIETITDWVSGELIIKAVTKGIDSVIKGVRLNDAQKQVVLSASGNTVNAPAFESGGEHYDNFIFNGSMCRGIEDVKLNVTLKDLANQLGEVNGDYTTVGTETSFLLYEDFYTDTEIISVPHAPSDEFTIGYNEMYNNNLFTFNYKSYETDKDEEGTINSIHTNTQWNIPNDKVTEEPQIEISFTRDPNKIKFIQEKSIRTNPTTALSEDNEVFILDCIQVPLNETRSLKAQLTHSVDAETGNLKLLNDGSFNWALLGSEIGDSFRIEIGENIANYTIISFDFTIVELEPISFTPTFNGSVFTGVKYEITTATYMNRTNEGFESITGIENSEDFSNLRYSIRRNMKRWESFLNTSMQNLASGTMNNLEFINGGNVTTQLIGEEPLTENADIVKANIAPAILSNEVLNKTLKINWSEYNTIENGIRSLRGYIRTTDNAGRMLKVYPRKYEWDHVKGILLIEEAEIRLESAFTEITTSNGIITINRTGYNSDIIGSIEYSGDGSIFTIYDKRYVPLIRPTHFSFFKINETQFLTADALSLALNTLINE